MLTRTALIAVSVTAALALAGCSGDDDDAATVAPAPPATTTATGGAGGETDTGLPVDRAFAQEMIPHHESAVEMAEIARERGESDFVRNLAEDIISTQTTEIETLESADQRLAAEGVEVGSLGVPMMEDMDMSMLETAEPFDAAFMEMMIEHHQSAIDMARAEQDRGEDPELKALAGEIIEAQQREIDEMREQLDAAGGGTDDMEGMEGH